ncbi:hypothetical protein BDQ17DRAFT_1184734, partial [Cyathus striatus]
SPPPKFMCFVNKCREAEEGVECEWEKVSDELHLNVVWFHSGMSSDFHEATIQKLKAGEIWGIICTEAAGM